MLYIQILKHEVIVLSISNLVKQGNTKYNTNTKTRKWAKKTMKIHLMLPAEPSFPEKKLHYKY